MSLLHVFAPRRNLGPDPRVALMLDRIDKDHRPSAAISKGVREHGAPDLEKRPPPPYARA